MTKKKMPVRSAAEIYNGCALVLFNTILAIALTNGAALLLFGVKRRIFPSRGFFPELSDKFTPDGAPIPNGKRSEIYQVALFDRLAFGDSATDQEIGAMLDEFHDFNLLPQSYLGVGLINPPEFDGKHIRLLTDEAGVRHRWTPSAEQKRAVSDRGVTTIYVFGGSTTFGVHAADKHTWPSYLVKSLSEAFPGRRFVVRNYGRPGYDSSNELLLFLLLLQRGQRPDVAVFLDGVNEHRSIDGGQFGNQEFARLVHDAYQPPAPKFLDLPVVKNSGFSLLADFLSRAMRRDTASAEFTARPASFRADNDLEKTARDMAENYLRTTKNIRAVAQANHIRSLLLLQPDASYNYPKHLFRRYPSFFSEEVSQVKGRFYEILRRESHSIYLGDLFEKWGDKKAIVDDCHYSPAFAEFLAREIASVVSENTVSAGSR